MPPIISSSFPAGTKAAAAAGAALSGSTTIEVAPADPETRLAVGENR